MPIERYAMPSLSPQYTPWGRYRNRGVRVHRTFCDFFRSRITVPEENPSAPTGHSKTFNRGSLVFYLNREIEMGRIADQNGNPVNLRQLNRGFGGWIGGSSDQRIREVYEAVFYFYARQAILDNNALEEPRMIELADLTKSPVKKGQPGTHALKVDEKTYFDGAVIVRLYLFENSPPQGVPYEGDQPALRGPVVFSKCSLEIITGDQEIDRQELIDEIQADWFKGVFYPIHLRQIWVRPKISNDEIADALVESFQRKLAEEELKIYRRVHGIEKAPVEVSDGLSEESPDFMAQYPLVSSIDASYLNPEIIGVDLYQHRIVKSDSPYDQCLLRIVIKNNEVNVPQLMFALENMVCENLRKGDWRWGLITVALDPEVFPDPQARSIRQQAIIEEIRAWQLASS